MKTYNNSKAIKDLFIAFFISALSSFFVVGCSTVTTPKVVASAAFNDTSYDYYTVQPSDTISIIAKKFKSDSNGIVKSNNLHFPYKVQVGQRLRIPVAVNIPMENRFSGYDTNRPEQFGFPARRTCSRAAECIYTYMSSEASVQQSGKPKCEGYIKKIQNIKRVNCIWPVKGKIVKTFSEDKSDGGRGIDIAGQAGQPVMASVAGKVVYSGAGLDKYGNSIIIKYNENFLTVYGFVKNSLVKEGEIVNQGEKIAEMDTNSKGLAILHFEIRKDGKTVNPLLYLKVQ